MRTKKFHAYIILIHASKIIYYFNLHRHTHTGSLLRIKHSKQHGVLRTQSPAAEKKSAQTENSGKKQQRQSLS